MAVPQVELQIEVMGFVGLIIATVMAYVRNEQQGRSNKERIQELDAYVKLEIQKLRVDYEKDLLKIEATHTTAITKVWEKLDTVNVNIMTLVQTFGEFKGRLARETD